MPGQVLTTASTVMCPHGGSAILTTSNVRVTAGALVLRETDIHPMAGCPFVIGLKPSPCIRIQWQAGATRVTVTAPVLVQSSIGICYSPESVPQGVAIIVNTQPKVSTQ